MMAAISCTVRSAMEQRSRPLSRLTASLKAVSDWMPSATVGLRGEISSPSAGFGFIITVLLPMGFSSCRCGSGVCCCKIFQDFVEGVDGDLDVLPLKNE